ncbi:MAG: hypothetical protein JWM31_3693 [Solirubrobacterales bacterium]|nr:hypothetical protein [Solirubrobacterales bacterium]
MHCPACSTTYGGPTMAAFGCCPLCLAEQGRVELLIFADDEPAPAAPPPTALDDAALTLPGRRLAHLN